MTRGREPQRSTVFSDAIRRELDAREQRQRERDAATTRLFEAAERARRRTTEQRAVVGSSPPAPLRQAAGREQDLAAQRSRRFPLEWDREAVWIHRGPSGEPTAIAIDDMSPETLFTILDWSVNQVTSLFQLYAPEEQLTAGHLPMGLAAKHWLATRPAFRAMVQAAIRKSVAFSDTTAKFIREFVMTAAAREVAVQAAPKPWEDAERLQAQSDLRSFINQPVKITTAEDVVAAFGRRGRAICLED